MPSLLLGLSVYITLGGVGSASGEPIAPPLGAASNLSHGQSPRMLRLGKSLGVPSYRDGINWRLAEARPGQYHFNSARLSYPDNIQDIGADLSLTLNWGNPLYDGGDTPHSPEAIAAFGAFSGALATRFPHVSALEIGNEFNGVNFVRGPVREMPPLARARAYAALLQAGSTAARQARPELRILGGATHSLAAGFLWEVLDAGGAAHMDALAIHPYTTPAEQLQRQVAVLRRHPDARRIPIEVTEFGHPNPALSADHMLRNYCQMALSGVTRAIWYPLNPRSDEMTPLYFDDGRITPAGKAFRFIRERMEGRPVQDAAPDPFTYGCQFGPDVLVLWGEERRVDVDDSVTVFHADGTEVGVTGRLSPERALVFIAAEGQEVAQHVSLGPQPLIADSYHQFAYPKRQEPQAEGDGFARFVRAGGKRVPLTTFPGQERRGTPWFPYRGIAAKASIRLTADTLLPGRIDGEPAEIVHIFTAPKDMAVAIRARLTPSDKSTDGVVLTLRRNGEVLQEKIALRTLLLSDLSMTLEAGDELEFSVSPGPSPTGDLTEYRIQILHP